MQTFRGRLRDLIRSVEAMDIVLVVGLALFAYGLSLLHHALPFVGVGSLLLLAWAGVARTSG